MLALFFGFELFLHLPNAWAIDQLSEASRFDRVFDSASSRSPSPRVAAFGSSRFQYGFVPAAIEEQLGWDQGSVSNLAFRAGTPQDFVNMYLEHRDQLQNLETLVVEIGAYSFNWTVIVDEDFGDLRFRRWAGIQERFEAPGVVNKIDYLFGYALRTWDARAVIRLTLTEAAFGDFDDSLPITRNGRINIFVPAQQGPEDATERPHIWDFRDFKFSEYQLRALSKLLDLAESDGTSVILVETPRSPSFDAEVEASYASEDGLWRERVESATGLQIVRLAHSDSLCAADWYKCAYDHAHMNPVGANSISSSVAQLLVQ